MKSMVTIEDFNRLDIRIGKVLSVEKVSGADKLLKFVFDLGEEKKMLTWKNGRGLGSRLSLTMW